MANDYYAWLTEQEQRQQQPQEDLWAIPTTPPAAPIDESPPATTGEIEAIIQQSQRPKPADWSANVNLNPYQSGGGKQGAGSTPAASGASNYAGWGRYYGGGY